MNLSDSMSISEDGHITVRISNVEESLPLTKNKVELDQDFFAEKLNKAEMDSFEIHHTDGILFSHREPAIKKIGSGYEVTYWESQERYFSTSQEITVEKVRSKISETHKNLSRKYSVYSVKEDSLVLIRDQKGKLNVPRNFSEKDVSEVFGIPTVLTTLTEINYV